MWAKSPSKPASPESAPASGRRAASRPGWLEYLVPIHVGVLLVFASWDFGGETDFAQAGIRWWGSLAPLILGYVCLRRRQRGEEMPFAVRWLWPLALFNLLVFVSAQNPSFTRSIVGGAAVFVNSGARPGWPSSAQPDLSLRALWQFDAIVLTCFNLAVIVTRRRVLRGLLFGLTVNALALAVMGTFQRLGRSPGLYFGLQPSPNEQFFATFIYHNHWGAFILLSASGALGLCFHYVRRANTDNRHSPAAFGLVATLFLAAAVPLSGSRSCSFLILVLLTGSFLFWLRALGRSGRLARRSKIAGVALAVIVFLGGLTGIYLLARPVIEARYETTRMQIADIRTHGNVGAREQLYSDTWRMAREKPWFGWGLGSYALVFQTFNQQLSAEGWVPFYAQAHSDWLQILAEVGAIGSLLLILLVLAPLSAALRSGRPGALAACLLAGCALLMVYAMVEFPFANPAVLIAFWTCFFAAIRYHQLSTDSGVP